MALEFASKKETFPHYRSFETDAGGPSLRCRDGQNVRPVPTAAAWSRYGDTRVLCNVTMSEKPREGIDFFPLSVDFEEKLYSVGRIPGSFMRREGRPGEKAILTSRVIDRPIRPLFPKDMRNDVSVVMTVMSVDHDCSPEIAGMIGTSIAISISDIPWKGPIAGVYMGLVDGELVVNPTLAQREKSDLQLTVAASMEKIVMIEAGANEVDEHTMLRAIKDAHVEIKKMIEFINGIVAEIGKPKIEFSSMELDHDLFEAVKDEFLDDFKAAMDTDDKNVRDMRLLPIRDRIAEKYAEQWGEGTIEELMYKMQKFVVRRWLLDEGKRVDGRGINEIRPLAAEVGLLPRVHGSGMFTRGQTQVLTTCTLSEPARRADHRRHLARRHQALHASLQLPAVLRGRGARAAQPRPPRDRPRRSGRARPAADDPLGGGVPVCAAPRVRGAVLQRLHQPGVHLRLHAGADGRRRAHQGAGRRHLLRPHHRGRPLDDHAGHPGRGGLPRRHGLQGRRHEERHHRHPDGHQGGRPDL